MFDKLISGIASDMLQKQVAKSLMDGDLLSSITEGKIGGIDLGDLVSSQKDGILGALGGDGEELANQADEQSGLIQQAMAAMKNFNESTENDVSGELEEGRGVLAKAVGALESLGDVPGEGGIDADGLKNLFAENKGELLSLISRFGK